MYLPYSTVRTIHEDRVRTPIYLADGPTTECIERREAVVRRPLRRLVLALRLAL